jgi:hypothetical protein
MKTKGALRGISGKIIYADFSDFFDCNIINNA